MEYFSFVSCFGHFLLDLALNQPAEQVSTAWGGVASRAVDGDTRLSTNWFSNTCMHTGWEKDAWWRVDLGAPFPVAEVVIVNRNCTLAEKCAAFMDSFQIKIGKANIQSTRVVISKARSPQVFLFFCAVILLCYVVSFTTDKNNVCKY